MLRVLGFAASINVRKVLWACEEIGVPYLLEPWGGREGRPTSDPAFRALNPAGLVPVVVDGDPAQGGLVLPESNTILRWLATRHERRDLLPPADAAHAAARARIEQWIDWQATEFNGAWLYAFLALVRRTPGHDDPAKIAASLAAWDGMVALIDAQLQKTGGHIAGPDFTLADIPVGLGLHRWMTLPAALRQPHAAPRPALPHAEAYHARLAARPAFAAHGSAAEI